MSKSLQTVLPNQQERIQLNKGNLGILLSIKKDMFNEFDYVRVEHTQLRSLLCDPSPFPPPTKYNAQQ